MGGIYLEIVKIKVEKDVGHANGWTKTFPHGQMILHA